MPRMQTQGKIDKSVLVSAAKKESLPRSVKGTGKTRRIPRERIPHGI